MKAVWIGGGIVAVALVAVALPRLKRAFHVYMYRDDEADFQNRMAAYVKAQSAKLRLELKACLQCVGRVRSHSPPLVTCCIIFHQNVEADVRKFVKDCAAIDSSSPVSGDSVAPDANKVAVTSKGHKGYYFFDSKGNRLPNKWCVCAYAPSVVVIGQVVIASSLLLLLCVCRVAGMGLM